MSKFKQLELTQKMKLEKDSPCIFSFGAGTQSTALLLLLIYEKKRILKALGRLPSVMLFADTGAESQESLNNLEKCKKISPIPIYCVKNWQRNANTHFNDVPAFFPKGGMGHRKCTGEWKIKPLHKAIKKLFPQNNYKNPVRMWLGISIDESQRIKKSRIKRIENYYPLIKMGLSRQDCYQILNRYDWNPVKSSCYMCPYQGNNWKDNPEIEKASQYEKTMQKLSLYNEIPFLHKSCEPIQLAHKKAKKQLEIWDIQNECDGICGV